MMTVSVEKKEYDILLVDDNEDDILLLKLALAETKTKCNVTTAKDGKTVLEMLEKLIDKGNKLPDLLFLDINLPKLNGLEVLSEIKSNKRTFKLPTVIFTSSDSMDDMDYCYENGADLYLKKPNNIREYRDIVDEVVRELLL